MKILQMSRCFFPYQAGASVRTYEIAKNLVDRGHGVDLLVHNPKSIGHAISKDKISREDIVDGIHVHRLGYLAPNYLYFIIVIPLMALEAIRIINKKDIDVILSDNPPYIVGLSSLIASIITRKPLVLNVHDPWGSKHHNLFEKVSGWFLEGLCSRKADKIIVASKTIPRTLKERYGIRTNKCVVALNAVDENRFEVSDKKLENVKNKYSLDSKKHIILFVGSLAKWNGVQYLIESAKYLDDKYEIVIAGGGIDEGELRAMGNRFKNIRFLGIVPYFEVPALIKNADVCIVTLPRVHSVGWEEHEAPVPLHLLEYMASGKPIVGSKVHVVEDLLIKYGGILVNPEDPGDLAGGIKKAVQIDDRIKGKVPLEYTWDNVSETIESELRKLTGKEN
jgi:glycosyltransferase involved in cell wall biosynthesis